MKKIEVIQLKFNFENSKGETLEFAIVDIDADTLKGEQMAEQGMLER